jgi:Aspartate/tyrosine/aromatic aminotransferase
MNRTASLPMTARKCLRCCRSILTPWSSALSPKNLSLPGERVGFAAVSPLLHEKAELMAALTLTNRILGFVNPPVVGQHIMAAALGSQVDLNVYAARRKAMGEVLKNAGYEFQMPAGAFYFFPKAPGGDDVPFVNRLVEERVLAVPGSGFGCPGYFRLAFCVGEEVIRKAADGFAKARASVK